MKHRGNAVFLVGPDFPEKVRILIYSYLPDFLNILGRKRAKGEAVKINDTPLIIQ